VRLSAIDLRRRLMDELVDVLGRIAEALERLASATQEPAAKPKAKPKRPEAPAYHPQFERWWRVYPRREGKASAARRWREAGARLRQAHGWSTQQAVDYLQERAEAFASTPKGQHPNLCPLPTTWLHQGRYDDDPARWQVAGDDQRPATPNESPAEGLDEYAA
jgi:hypothetical protein